MDVYSWTWIIVHIHEFLSNKLFRKPNGIRCSFDIFLFFSSCVVLTITTNQRKQKRNHANEPPQTSFSAKSKMVLLTVTDYNDLYMPFGMDTPALAMSHNDCRDDDDDAEDELFVKQSQSLNKLVEQEQEQQEEQQQQDQLPRRRRSMGDLDFDDDEDNDDESPAVRQWSSMHDIDSKIRRSSTSPRSILRKQSRFGNDDQNREPNTQRRVSFSRRVDSKYLKQCTNSRKSAPSLRRHTANKIRMACNPQVSGQYMGRRIYV